MEFGLFSKIHFVNKTLSVCWRITRKPYNYSLRPLWLRTATGANEMKEERNRWSEQFSSNIGASELLRLGCFVVIWMLLAVALSSIFYTSQLIQILLFTIFLISLFAFAIFSQTWKPAYSLLRKIFGNKNLPNEPMPPSTVKTSRQRLPWWGYLFGIWFLLLDLLILYIILKRH